VDYERPYNGLQEAEELLRYLLSVNPEKRLYYALLGSVYMRMKDFPSAAEAFIKAGLYYQAGVAYLRTEDEKALDSLQMRLFKRRHPDAFKILLLKAESFRRASKTEEAEKFLWQVYKFSEQDREEALWRLAWLSYLKRDLYSAMARLKRLNRLWPKDKYSYWLKKTLLKLGRPEEAKKIALNGDGFYSKIDEILEIIVTAKAEEPFRVTATQPSGLRPILVGFTRGRFLEKTFFPSSLERARALILLGQRELALKEALWQFNTGHVGADETCEFFRTHGFWYMMPWCEKRVSEQRAMSYRYPFAYPEMVIEVSEKTGVDPLLILAVMKQESRFRPSAISRSGAIGLMQLMPFTAERFLKTDQPVYKECLVPEKNIYAGARYLRFLLDRFQNIAYAVAAYNAGEGSVGRWLEGFAYEGPDEFMEDIPYAETNYYTKVVLSNYYHYRNLYKEVSLNTK
ncbi:MAG: hypothetical protein D6778_10820, partial [Nitrospirae bacterium]